MLDHEKLHLLALCQIPNIGPATARQLIEYFGSASKALHASKDQFSPLGLMTPEKITSISVHKSSSLAWADQEALRIEKKGVHLVDYRDVDFPRKIKNLKGAPILLYVKGMPNLNRRRCIAVVGTRKPTAYGRRMCTDVVEGLKNHGVTIVSGLAYGVDATAHKAAIDHDIDTWAILGNGLESIYPSEHASLANKIVSKGGVLISEFDMLQMPDRQHFPMRNRIVAGMCDAVLVVESAVKGGSMITSKIALQFGIPVFALPGRLGDKMSEGCNKLIKNNHAILLDDVNQISNLLNWNTESPNPSRQAKLFTKLSTEEAKLVDILQTQDDMSVDEIMNQLKISNSQLAALLLNLEFEGIVYCLPGKRYSLV